MANKASFQMVSEGRGERRLKRKHGNNVLQMRSISCPGESGYFSESLENHVIHENNQDVKRDRSRTERTGSDHGRRSRSFSSNNTSENLSPETNSSVSIYTDVRYDEINSFQKRKHSKHVSEDIGKKNGHVNERSSSDPTRPRHSRNARRKRGRNEDSGVEKYDSYCGNSLDGHQPRKERSSSKTMDEQGRTNSRHRSGKHYRSTSNASSEFVSGDSRKRASRHSRKSGKSSRNDTATSYDIPGMDPYPFNGYLKSSSKTDTRNCRWCSRRKVFLCLGCMFFTFVVALVLVGYLMGYFDSTKSPDPGSVHRDEATPSSFHPFTTSPPPLLTSSTSHSSSASNSSGSSQNTNGKPSNVDSKKVKRVDAKHRLSLSGSNQPLLKTTNLDASVDVTQFVTSNTDEYFFSMDLYTSSTEKTIFQGGLPSTLSKDLKTPENRRTPVSPMASETPKSVTPRAEVVIQHDQKDTKKKRDIKVVGMDNISVGMSAQLTCTLSNFKQRHLRKIIIQQTATQKYITYFYPKENSPKCNTNRHGNTYVKSCFEWVSEKELHVTVNFDVFTCSQSGNYECIVILNNRNSYSKSGFLHYKESPSAPLLSVPEDLIDGREPTEPVTCSANTGYPVGQIEWHIKRKGRTNFERFDGFVVRRTGECGQMVHTALFYTPTIDANGTMLKCVVTNDLSRPPSELATVEEIRILPNTLCDNVTEGQKIAHPFTCTKFIQCADNEYVITECPNSMCFDETNGVCGQKRLTMSSVVAYLNEGVTSLKCHLTHLGTWRNITISKQLETGETYNVITVTRGSPDPYVHDSVMKDRVYAHVDDTKDYEVAVNMWIYVLTCGDEGLYTCHADPDFSIPPANATLQLLAKPEAPSLSIPSAIVEDLTPSHPFICESNVGYPHGELSLHMRLHNDTDFYPVPYNVSTQEEDLNCSALIRKSFRFEPGLEHNGMELQCAVSNPVTLPLGFNLVATKTIHVVPRNFCTVHDSDIPHVHPYDCQQYVQCTKSVTYVQTCSGKFCFNPETHMCDIPLQEETVPFDPHRPCAPDKNGIYFPHPVLCNKFLWCVQGQEVVQHCPLGTLYLDGGQCTFEPALSKCYTGHNLTFGTVT